MTARQTERRFAAIARGQAMRIVGGPVTRPVWSRDGAKIALELHLSGETELWMIEAQSLAQLRAFQVAHHPEGKPATFDLKAPFQPRGNLVPIDLQPKENRLLAVGTTDNLQETPQAINALLARLELKTTVALDRNGAVAEKYAAVAIPQTVIIDANGNVARLFVGGGPQYIDQLCEALEAEVMSATGQGTSP